MADDEQINPIEEPVEGELEDIFEEMNKTIEPGEAAPDSDLQKERDQLEERLARVSADYQNFVRRSQQEAITLRQAQMVDLAKSLTTVMDHFDHAMNVDIENTSTGDLMQGVHMVRDELLKTLEQFGVRRLDVEPGEEFDPNRHEAMMRQASDDVKTNHVVAQLQPGYTLGEMTVRPAKVTVAE